MKPKNPSNTSPEIRIIGDNVMQNDLLSSFIEKKTGLKSLQQSRFDFLNMEKKILGMRILFLLDTKSSNFFEIWDSMESRSDHALPDYFFALFNLDPDPDVGLEALARGIRGVFFSNQPIDIIPKGVQAILDGEIWYPRRTMSQYLISEIGSRERDPKISVPLTEREKEILFMLFSGESNTEIADHFHISYHTVKTHIYNIYRKINAKNRFQATLWAAKNL